MESDGGPHLNTQERLTEEHRLTLENLLLKEQITNKDEALVQAARALIAAQKEAFRLTVAATYGNPGENVQIATDGFTIARTPV